MNPTTPEKILSEQEYKKLLEITDKLSVPKIRIH